MRTTYLLSFVFGCAVFAQSASHPLGKQGMRREGTWFSGMQESLGDAPRSIILDDFDADGTLDLVTSNYDAASLTMIRGGGQGGGAGRVVELKAGWFPGELASGDFDGDGFQDVLVVNRHSDSVSFLRGGKEGLRPGTEIAVGAFPDSLMTGDLDRDGFLDAMVWSRDSGTLALLRGGSGGPRRVRDLAIGDAWKSLPPSGASIASR